MKVVEILVAVLLIKIAVVIPTWIVIVLLVVAVIDLRIGRKVQKEETGQSTITLSHPFITLNLIHHSFTYSSFTFNSIITLISPITFSFNNFFTFTLLFNHLIHHLFHIFKCHNLLLFHTFIIITLNIKILKPFINGTKSY